MVNNYNVIKVYEETYEYLKKIQEELEKRQIKMPMPQLMERLIDMDTNINIKIKEIKFNEKVFFK